MGSMTVLMWWVTVLALWLAAACFVGVVIGRCVRLRDLYG